MIALNELLTRSYCGDIKQMKHCSEKYDLGEALIHGGYEDEPILGQRAECSVLLHS